MPAGRAQAFLSGRERGRAGSARPSLQGRKQWRQVGSKPAGPRSSVGEGGVCVRLDTRRDEQGSTGEELEMKSWRREDEEMPTEKAMARAERNRWTASFPCRLSKANPKKKRVGSTIQSRQCERVVCPSLYTVHCQPINASRQNIGSTALIPSCPEPSRHAGRGWPESWSLGALLATTGADGVGVSLATGTPTHVRPAPYLFSLPLLQHGSTHYKGRRPRARANGVESPLFVSKRLFDQSSRSLGGARFNKCCTCTRTSICHRSLTCSPPPCPRPSAW